MKDNYSNAVAQRNRVAGKVITPVSSMQGPVGEEVLIDPTSVTGVGVTSNIGNLFAPNSPLPGTLTFDFTAGATDEIVMLFDAANANEITRGLTVLFPNTNYGDNDVVKDFFKGNSMMFKGFNYEVSNLATLNRQINYGRAIFGDDKLAQITPAAYTRNTAQNPLLVTFTGNILITPETGIWINVPAGETVTFNFYFAGWFNAFGRGQ
jgi:hypothetical protein